MSSRHAGRPRLRPDRMSGQLPAIPQASQLAGRATGPALLGTESQSQPRTVASPQASCSAKLNEGQQASGATALDKISFGCILSVARWFNSAARLSPARYNGS